MIEQIKSRITEKSAEITTLKDMLSRAQQEMAQLQSELRAAKAPVIGERKTVERFAFLPVVADNRWVWLRRYYDLVEYQNKVHTVNKTSELYLSLDDLPATNMEHRTEWVLVDRTVYPY